MIEITHFILLILFIVIIFVICKSFDHLNKITRGAVIASILIVISVVVLRIVVIAIYMPYYYRSDDWAPFLGAYFGIVYGAIGGGIYGIIFTFVSCKEFKWLDKFMIGGLFGTLYGAISLSTIWSVTSVAGNPFTNDIISFLDGALLLLFPLLGAFIGKVIPAR